MLAKQTKDKDMERVKSQPKVYFQKVHQMVI
jgi:ethanolamine utilization cobalamin adenosyltransferase